MDYIALYYWMSSYPQRIHVLRACFSREKQRIGGDGVIFGSSWSVSVAYPGTSVFVNLGPESSLNRPANFASAARCFVWLGDYLSRVITSKLSDRRHDRAAFLTPAFQLN